MTVWKKNKSFSKKIGLEQHIISRMIDQKEAQRVRCIECVKGFKSNKYLKDHIKREHFSGHRETCDECGAELKDRQNACIILNIRRKKMITLSKESKI